MATLNSVAMVGRLVRDADYKTLPTGTDMCSITIASNYERKKYGSAEVEIEVCYIPVTLWGKEAALARNLRKGAEVFVEGRLKFAQWDDKKSGEKKTRHEIVATSFIHNYKLDSVIENEETLAYQEPVKVQPKVQPKP